MKRFYRSAVAGPCEGGFHILLDGRLVKTPLKNTLEIPSRALAEAICAEWEAQEKKIDPATMPLTRMANTALDRVMGREQDVVREIAAFGDSELVCYRADQPDNLVKRQCEAWDSYLERLNQKYGVQLETVCGIRHVAQSEGALKKLTGAIAAHDLFELTALHSAVSLTGSLVIGLALVSGDADAEQAFRDSHLDELYQAERWGAEQEAEDRRTAIRLNLAEIATYLMHHRSS